MSKPNGGPAFPVTNNKYMDCMGISVRDYFAAHAPLPNGKMTQEEMAMYCYQFADTMLAERNKSEEETK